MLWMRRDSRAPCERQGSLGPCAADSRWRAHAAAADPLRRASWSILLGGFRRLLMLETAVPVSLNQPHQDASAKRLGDSVFGKYNRPDHRRRGLLTVSRLPALLYIHEWESDKANSNSE